MQPHFTLSALTLERMDETGQRMVRRGWFQLFCRIGLFVKGVMYLMIGGLAGLAAMKAGGAFLNLYGAMAHMASMTLGIALLAIAVIGNIGYSCFKIVAAVFDTDRKGSNPVGLFKRLGMIFKAFVHLSVAVVAVRLLIGYQDIDDTGDAYVQALTAELMALNYATWIVYALGLYLVACGFMQFYMIYTAYFRRRLILEKMTTRSFRFLTMLARIGYAARGVVAIAAGSGLVLAAWLRDPTWAHGMGGILKALGDQPYVPYVLGLVAVGLVSYGLFEILLVRYRRISDIARPAKT
jgi:hypothetical protein